MSDIPPDTRVHPQDRLSGVLRQGDAVIPAGMARDVIDAAVAAMAKEDLVRAAILSGVDPQEAYLRHGKF